MNTNTWKFKAFRCRKALWLLLATNTSTFYCRLFWISDDGHIEEADAAQHGGQVRHYFPVPTKQLAPNTRVLIRSACVNYTAVSCPCPICTTKLKSLLTALPDIAAAVRDSW